MRFAVISDIHGNNVSLEAVIKDINTRDVDYILCAGDLVGYLPFPNEVIETIRNNRILAIQGNHDEYFATSHSLSETDVKHMSKEDIQSGASKIYTQLTLTDSNKRYLRELPKQLRLQFEHFNILMVHGSPRINNEYLYQESETVKEVAKEYPEHVIICGHTHKPYHTVINNTHFINAGSIGKPKHGNSNATYVLVDIDGDSLKTSIIETEYNVTAIVNEIKNNPYISDHLIQLLQDGQ
ncbi:metallophosphoesterase family protein [Haloplasma contractile]|uniref:Phosphoesterase n=1 Tax=Haloplasma contractile SSD-17B TaxID=1033810 RepID=U2FE08_9MOLU|nr:YfcE family phosphodiesterase [Haloplasma contractile]ERJ11210.1 Metallophosphoesterase calcineurin superfamily protein [Haloplasma contractile SSD-17B]